MEHTSNFPDCCSARPPQGGLQQTPENAFCCCRHLTLYPPHVDFVHIFLRFFFSEGCFCAKTNKSSLVFVKKRYSLVYFLCSQNENVGGFCMLKIPIFTFVWKNVNRASHYQEKFILTASTSLWPQQGRR